MKSSRPGSAQWRSSKTSTVGPRSAIRSKSVRQAAVSSSVLPVAAPSRPSRAARRGSTRARSSASARYSAVIAASFDRATSGGSDSAIRARPRTISPSAQNASPSPYAGDRPWCQ